MGDRKLVIEGEEYISSARAAELVGYSKDYVGQLARGGKIDAKRVGRNWYIREASINKHKLSVHYTLTKPRNTESKIYSNTAISRLENKISDKKGDDEVVFVPEITKNSNKSFYTKVTNSAHIKTEDIQRDVEIHDLFPNPEKRIRQERDVLLQSNITYHKEPKEVQETSNVSTGPDAFIPVAVRRPTVSTRPVSSGIRSLHEGLLHNNESARKVAKKHVSVDGVIITKKRRTLNYERNFDIGRLRENTSAIQRDSDRNANDMSTELQSQTESELSKAIPVIGAIVLFTIVAVIYIVISA